MIIKRNLNTLKYFFSFSGPFSSHSIGSKMDFLKYGNQVYICFKYLLYYRRSRFLYFIIRSFFPLGSEFVFSCCYLSFHLFLMVSSPVFACTILLAVRCMERPHPQRAIVGIIALFTIY